MTLRTAPASVPGVVIWRQTYSGSKDVGGCCTSSAYRLRDLEMFPSPLHGRISAKLYRHRLDTIDNFFSQYQLYPPALRCYILLGFLLLFLSLIVCAILITPFFAAGIGAILIMFLIAGVVIHGIRLNKLQTEMQKIMDTFNAEDNRIGLYWRSYFCVTIEYGTNHGHGPRSFQVHSPSIDVSLVGEEPIPNATYVQIMPMDSSILPPYPVDNSAQIQHSNDNCK